MLAGKVALVTGGATRLGREIALALARVGANVGFSYLTSADDASRTASDIMSLGRTAAAIRCDLRHGAEIDGLVASTTAALGPIDLLVLSAAVFRRTPIEAATEEDWDFHMDANAKSVYLCGRKVGVEMRRRGSGAIVVIADVAGLQPWGNYVPYSASKAAAVSLTQGLAIALAPQVRVNAIAPGPILPPAGPRDEEALRRAASRTLLGRHGKPENITDAVLYLATADYVTGAVLPVDGGRHLA